MITRRMNTRRMNMKKIVKMIMQQTRIFRISMKILSKHVGSAMVN